MDFEPIQGVKSLREILDDSSRQYGVKVHEELPAKTVDFSAVPYADFIKHPEELELIERLVRVVGDLPDSMEFPEAYAATVEDGLIVGNSGMVVTPDHYVIAETASLSGYGDGRCLRIENLKDPSVELGFQGTVDSNVFSAGNPSGGYSHHLMESLFSMLWFIGKGIGHVHVAKGSNQSRMAEFFADLGIPPETLISSQKNQFLKAKEVSFFGPSNFLLLRKETCEMLEKKLVAGRRSKDPPFRKLYLESKSKLSGARARLQRNESALQEFLCDDGFEVIDPAELSLVDKIKVFSEAKQVISASGSALANPLYFCPENARVGGLVYAENLVKSFCSPHKFRVMGYSDLPIFDVYPELCMDNGRPLSQWAMTVRSHIERYPILQQLSYSLDWRSSEIDMKRFREWYKLFVS